MTTTAKRDAIQVVLDSIPGPESDGVHLAPIMKECCKQGINDSDCCYILKCLEDDGLIEKFEAVRDRGTRDYYRQTEKAVAV